MAICRCINFAHPEHAGKMCSEPAMADEGLCEACHEHDSEEMGTILKSPTGRVASDAAAFMSPITNFRRTRVYANMNLACAARK
jgi:hypothetical protein